MFWSCCFGAVLDFCCLNWGCDGTTLLENDVFFVCVFMWMFVSVLEMEWTFKYLSTDSLVITWSCCITVAYVTDATTSPSPSESTYCWLLIWLGTTNSFIGREWAFISLWCSCSHDIWKSQFCVITINMYGFYMLLLVVWGVWWFGFRLGNPLMNPGLDS